jgi:ABC-type transporter Mla subunit MlaD
MKNLFYLIIMHLLFSCKAENKTLIITFDHASGLIEGNSVVINDFQVGQVSKITLNSDYKINAEIEINDTIRLPKDSKFIIGSKDLFSKAIIVIPGKSKSFLMNKDRVKGQLAQSIQLDKVIDVFTDEINNSKPVKNQDSIISELHKINVQLEEINKK